MSLPYQTALQFGLQKSLTINTDMLGSILFQIVCAITNDAVCLMSFAVHIRPIHVLYSVAVGLLSIVCLLSEA